MAATKNKEPAYVAPENQLALQDRITELREQLAKIGPGEGLAYRDDVRDLALKSFRDLRAAKEAERRTQLEELRQLLCVEVATGIDHVFLNHLDGVGEEELLEAIAAPAPVGYQDIISPHSKAEHVEERQRIESEIQATEDKLRRLEVTEEIQSAQRRLAELETNGEEAADVA